MEFLFLNGNAIAFIGAALAVGLACIGSAKGTGIVGEAGAGVLSEDPGRFAQVLILQILPGTQGLYGFVIWFLALSKFGGITPEAAELSLITGVRIFAACMPIAIGGFLSAIAQGRVAAAGVLLIAKRAEELGKGILMAVVVEFYAILCLLASFLMLRGINV